MYICTKFVYLQDFYLYFVFLETKQAKITIKTRAGFKTQEQIKKTDNRNNVQIQLQHKKVFFLQINSIYSKLFVCLFVDFSFPPVVCCFVRSLAALNLNRLQKQWKYYHFRLIQSSQLFFFVTHNIYIIIVRRMYFLRVHTSKKYILYNNYKE